MTIKSQLKVKLVDFYFCALGANGLRRSSQTKTGKTGKRTLIK